MLYNITGQLKNHVCILSYFNFCSQDRIRTCISANTSLFRFIPYSALPISPPDYLQLISDVSRKVAKPIQPTIWLLYASCSYGKPKRNYDPVAYWHFAIRGGVEPPCCDSVRNNIAGFVVNPYSNTYFVISAHETSGCVCRSVRYFTTR